ncbi:UNKNOWN [Stylonychia lemnae]|uniref:TLDc domain-containing protein n=1 Tax=Stylonychia lemnae TaxID=5949 RepID=A0A078AGT7_STYLE|nr:UNKNOWN [Stylonychia lemnae]|eukprot:CDW81419.1 UNKNOWN [Stylonychia lemnae]
MDTFKSFVDQVNLAFNKNIKSLTQVFTGKTFELPRDAAMNAIVKKSNIFGFIKTKAGSMLGFYYEEPILSTSTSANKIQTRTMIYGISTGIFSKKEIGDNYQTEFGPWQLGKFQQILTTPRAQIIFHPSCLYYSYQPNKAQCYSSSNFDQQEYCQWILQKPQGDDSVNFECLQIEYYEGKENK